LKLAVNSTIPGLLRLGDLKNVHAVAFRTDDSHGWNDQIASRIGGLLNLKLLGIYLDCTGKMKVRQVPTLGLKELSNGS
jgi:hypothetical protein